MSREGQSYMKDTGILINNLILNFHDTFWTISFHQGQRGYFLLCRVTAQRSRLLFVVAVWWVYWVVGRLS